jgi:heterodisulfide reductase subunit B
MGMDRLATPCPSCLSALKTAESYAGKDEGRKLLSRLCGMEAGEGMPAYSLLQVILDEAGTGAVQAAAVRPLSGLKAATYYGCLLSRPSGLMDFDEPENPVSMDKLLKAAGAEVIDFALKVECCGAGLGVPKREVVCRLSGRILDMAVRQGADVLVAACPLCHQNLDLRQAQLLRTGGSEPLPVLYFTQMLGLAMGLSPESLGLNLHAVGAEGLLDRIAAPQNES